MSGAAWILDAQCIRVICYELVKEQIYSQTRQFAQMESRSAFGWKESLKKEAGDLFFSALPLWPTHRSEWILVKLCIIFNTRWESISTTVHHTGFNLMCEAMQRFLSQPALQSVEGASTENSESPRNHLSDHQLSVLHDQSLAVATAKRHFNMSLLAFFC